VRVFGGTDGLLNRPVENVIFEELSSQGISPRLIGKYPWGRLEEFLWDRNPLASGRDMISITPEADMISLLSRQLAVLHSVELKVSESFASANVFDVAEKWFHIVESRYSDTIRRSISLPPESRCPSISVLREELSTVKSICLDEVAHHPSVIASSACQQLLAKRLCHNDLLSGNLMYRSSDRSLRFIDFEYSGFNYAVADIANVFTAVCESIMLSGEPHDVRANFPSRHIQLRFAGEYLGEDKVDNEEAVLLLIRAFAMADELRWTIWGIIQSQQTAVEFDYCMYYNARFNGYLAYKDTVLGLLNATR
jgi:hypothetical protein